MQQKCGDKCAIKFKTKRESCFLFTAQKTNECIDISHYGGVNSRAQNPFINSVTPSISDVSFSYNSRESKWCMHEKDYYYQEQKLL